jgi:hypothetical protein
MSEKPATNINTVLINYGLQEVMCVTVLPSVLITFFMMWRYAFVNRILKDMGPLLLM